MPGQCEDGTLQLEEYFHAKAPRTQRKYRIMPSVFFALLTTLHEAIRSCETSGNWMFGQCELWTLQLENTFTPAFAPTGWGRQRR